MKEFNLTDRTTKFSKNLIIFCNKIPRSIITNPLISQVIRSGTSIGANYCEANDSYSRKDMLHKISIVRKEAKETIYWLRLLQNVIPNSQKEKLQNLTSEVVELKSIFSTIIKKLN